jgi:hypothetical protein
MAGLWLPCGLDKVFYEDNHETVESCSCCGKYGKVLAGIVLATALLVAGIVLMEFVLVPFAAASGPGGALLAEVGVIACAVGSLVGSFFIFEAMNGN